MQKKVKMININQDNYKSNNIFSIEEVLPILKKLRNQGKKIGLCTGSFDLLHPGHITHLDSAKRMCDILVVGLAKDCFSKNKNLGSGRPIYSQELRAFMVSKLKSVDYVFFDDGKPEIIMTIKPDVYFKGKDYFDETNPNIIAQKKMMESLGGKMIFTQDEKLSTTDIIKHI